MTTAFRVDINRQYQFILYHGNPQPGYNFSPEKEIF